MNAVYLWAWKRLRIDPAQPHGLLNQPFSRRMTALQKAVLLCLNQLAEEQPAALAMARESMAPLFFCSAFGEIGPLLRLTRSILAHDLPVSPKDFQHSVLNAALSYLAIHQDWHQAGYALSGGFAGPDSTLHLAAQRLSSGLDASCLLVHAYEYPGQAGEGEAEILILSRKPPEQKGFLLQESRWSLPDDTKRLYRDEQDLVPWLIEDDQPVPGRFVPVRGHQGWVTVWKPI